MTFLLAFSSLLSRILGFLRNSLLAHVFGAGVHSDAYFAAFQIPDTMYRLLVAGAISASFVPLFLLIKKTDEKKAWEFTSSVLNSFLLIIGSLSVLLFFFARELTHLLYPSFSPEILSETTSLLRIVILSPILFTFSSVLSGIQNAFRTFLGFAIAPIVYNLGIIFGIVFLAPRMGIQGVAVGVVIGCFLHVLVQWIPAIRLGFRWNLTLKLTPVLKKFFWTMLPRVFSMASLQLIYFIEGIIATALAAGDLSMLRFAEDIQFFPIGIVGLSMAISSFSVMSHLAIDKKHEELSVYVRDKLDHLLMILIPCAFGIFLLRVPLVTLALKGGQFEEAQVTETAKVLGVLSLDIVATAMIPLLSRVFFSFHDTALTFVVTLSTVLLNTLLAVVLSHTYGIMGIAFAGAFAATAAVVIFLILMRLKYFKDFSFFSLPHFFVFTLASAGMSLALSHLLSLFSFSDHWITLFAQVAGVTLIGATVYGVLLFLFLGKKTFTLLSRIGE